MKKTILFIALLFVSFCLFAQEFKESEYYYFSYPIEKIYKHRLGYMVVYRRSSNQTARTFIPIDWFNTIGGKGEIVGMSSGREWPTMVVYHKNGEFSHVRLRLRPDVSHETWGVFPLNINMDEYFQGVEEVKLEF